MNKPVEHSVGKASDSIQKRLADYASALHYDQLPAPVVRAAKVAVIDTLGALIAGFFGEPCQIARGLAAQMIDPEGVAILGTRMKTSADMAAFVNGTTARYAELTDIYHWPGSFVAHPGDTVMPILAAAEHVRADGRSFIAALVVSYEVCLRISHFLKLEGFDNTNLSCLGTAVAAGKILGLSAAQLSHCISMAVVPNVILKQARSDQKSMFKAVAAGYAGRAGVFAAVLARAGMEGPHLPFEGKAGWCDHVAGGRFALNEMGGGNTGFKILDVRIKNRPAAGPALAPILAAEKIAPVKNLSDVAQITVEVHQTAKERSGSSEHAWNLTSREDADHSIPFLVAMTLRDGTVTLRSFSDSNVWDRDLRDLMQKIEVVENAQYTQAYEQVPQEHHARIIVTMRNGEKLDAHAGGDEDDLAAPKSDAQIEQKFRSLTEDFLGAGRSAAILERLWSLEDLSDTAALASGVTIA